MPRCIAIDDEPLALDIIQAYVGRFPELELVQVFEDALAAAEFLRHTPVDILFVDINMPDITGLDLVRSLQERPVVIFTTAYRDFALEGFDLEALDYLLKPIDFDRFAKAVRRALEYLEQKNRPAEAPAQYLYVFSEYRQVKINVSHIEYIESLEDYIRIHLQQARPVMTLMSLKKVLEKLPGQQFKRIHRSYIVPVGQVVAIHHRKVQLSSGKELPISDSYTSFIQEWLNQQS
jgi:two-component system, LytTR family, response regulator